MKRFHLILLCTAFLAVHVNAFAQDTSKPTITGKITDARSGAPLDYATISLFRQADSSLVNGALTDDTGVFRLEAEPGAFYAKVEFLAFQPSFIGNIQLTADHPSFDVGTVELRPDAATLDEVIVQAERSTMQLALDKKIFNVGKDLANAGGNAADILGNIPSVVVDPEGNVSLRGSSNVRILVDGKPSGLVSFKGGSGLQQLQGNMIERVEIITNPSARYEAEGMGGIINIVLKKERKQGLNGSFDVIAGNPTNFGGALNLNYRKENFNFFINYGSTYRDIPGYGDLYQEVYGDTTFIYSQHSDRTQSGFFNTVRLGTDYYFDDKNILTFSYIWRRSKGKRNSYLEYRDYLFSSNNLVGISTRTQDEEEIEPNNEYTLNYEKRFKRDGQELTAVVRYLDNWEDSQQDFVERTFDTNFNPSGKPDLLQHSDNYETEKQWLFQVDYVHPFKNSKEGKFEAGLRSQFRDMTNDYFVEELKDGEWQILPGLANDFRYDENIHATYAILGDKIQKFSYQLGLRAEWSQVTTKLLQTNEVKPREYANFFPSAHFTYDLPQENALQISYSRRIRRPTYNDLSPFSTYLDNRNFFSGNPELDPEFTNSFELGHIKYFENASLSSSIYYRHTDDRIERIRRVDEQGNSSTQPENLAIEDAYGAEFVASYNFAKWWKQDGNFNFFRSIIDGKNLDDSFTSDTYSWFARLTSRFTFWKNTDLQLRGNYEAPQKTPQGSRKANAFVDVALSQDILKGDGTLTLNVLDLFNSRKWRSITEGEIFFTESVSQFRPRQVNLTFSYRLHQAKLPGRGNANPDGVINF